ncbi:MAG: hypothetical protein BWY63_02185 [Chloroflexi bacterium ADurb.Bin360]|nr:MAG: hypothetical protein BWY63_02185 [Chloroflexi bacterium ADurb.Bin360]
MPRHKSGRTWRRLAEGLRTSGNAAAPQAQRSAAGVCRTAYSNAYLLDC